MRLDDFFIPGEPKDQLDPDDCPACQGAGGFFVPTGCFSVKGRRCADCEGAGKLTTEQKRRIRVSSILCELRNISADISSAAITFVRDGTSDLAKHANNFSILTALVDKFTELEESLNTP